MKTSHLIIFLMLFALLSCSKSNSPSGTGTVTIDNKTYQSTTYYVYGFSFSKNKKVTTLENPGPDVIAFINSDTPPARLTLQANNQNPSFYKIGDYQDAQSATTAFNELKTVGTYTWVEMADPINANQVWVYRTQTNCYAKIRIISSVVDNTKNPVFGECTFEYAYQADGSTTFPAK